MKIDAETLGFMRKHGIAESEVYAATSQHSSEWKPAMRKACKRFAYVDTPCRKGGHRLYNHGQACVVCRPIFIGMSKHHHSRGEVYVAVSESAGLVKVGGTTTDRTKTLNRQSYGEIDDWRIVHCEKVKEVGKIERLAQAELKSYQVKGLIYRADEREADEIFRCPPEVAIAAVKRAAASN